MYTNTTKNFGAWTNKTIARLVIFRQLIRYFILNLKTLKGQSIRSAHPPILPLFLSLSLCFFNHSPLSLYSRNRSLIPPQSAHWGALNRMLMTSLPRSDWSVSVTNSPHMGQTKKPLCLCHSLPPLCVDSLLSSALFFYSLMETGRAESCVRFALIGSDQKQTPPSGLVRCVSANAVITSHPLHLPLIICSLLF